MYSLEWLNLEFIELCISCLHCPALFSNLSDSVFNFCDIQLFCFVAMAAYAVDVVLQVIDIRRKFDRRHVVA